MPLKISGRTAIKVFLENPSESSMQNLVLWSNRSNFSNEDIAELALGLARSGATITPATPEAVYDIPSTGGPGSLSTLLTPLALARLGGKVIKLGVPGRPAGGVDVLAQIKNYNIKPSVRKVKEWIKNGCYVHILANEVFAPLDIRFFNYRKKTNNLNIPAFVVASILSKKIALGITSVGLDVRVSAFGNFGNNWNDARINAKLFNDVSRILGINSKCFITNGFYPAQPYIGRGESLLALHKIFSNKDTGSLHKHRNHCYSMAISLMGKNVKIELTGKGLKEEFINNLRIQGGSYDSFLELAGNVERKHTFTLRSTKSGFVHVNLEKIRNIVVAIQGKFISVDFPDPCGVILIKEQFDYAKKDDVLCSFRCPKGYQNKFSQSLEGCFEIVDVINHSGDLEEIV